LGQVLVLTSAASATHKEIVRLSPQDLKDGSQLTLISPANWRPLLDKVAASLTQTHEDFKRLFGAIPVMNTSVHLMDQESFFRSTGAPRWTVALYFHEQIMIPLAPLVTTDFENIIRSIRHEYTHAVIHALSAGKCPGWLDEGLAEWAEGQANPNQERTLMSWLRVNPPVKLKLLQGGFTELEPEMAAAAYAQSLFAAERMIEVFGFRSIRTFFDTMRAGSKPDAAFKDAFKMSENSFEAQLGRDLSKFDKMPHHNFVGALFGKT
jgi:hypothetical protein